MVIHSFSSKAQEQKESYLLGLSTGYAYCRTGFLQVAVQSKVDCYGSGLPKNKTYPSASSTSKPLKLSLLLSRGLLNTTAFE
jgi:hypothetical protein